MMKKTERIQTITGNRRHSFVVVAFVAFALFLPGRAVMLYDQENLQQTADGNHVRIREIPARRGMIIDRGGELLAANRLVYNVGVDPRSFDFAGSGIERLAGMLDLDAVRLRERIQKKQDRRFVYVKRDVEASLGKRIGKLFPGVSLERDHRRFYPMREAAAHLVGLTDVDNVGIEGVEKQFDDVLRAVPGKKKVFLNSRGDVFRVVELTPRKAGTDLKLTLDHNIQYRAYRVLTAEVKKHAAKGGAMVLLDAQSGEVLAMVNQPSFDPNAKRVRSFKDRRNRVLLDVFEPGSTIKPFIAAILLDGGYLSPDTEFDTSQYEVAGRKIVDISNYGALSLSGVIIKSSNVGMSKAVELIPSADLWQGLLRSGFGRRLGTGFPGEAGGTLPHYLDWKAGDQAPLSFGYGISVTLMQLAHAYSVFANDGWRPPLSLVVGTRVAERAQVFRPDTARAVRQMLVQVVARGTGKRARIKGFTAAGKTGTTEKNRQGRYEEGRNLSLFVGFAPADRPRLIAAVMIDEPGGQEHMGGAVAAPVFSELMQYALWRLRVPGDETVPLDPDDDDIYMLADE